MARFIKSFLPYQAVAAVIISIALVLAHTAALVVMSLNLKPTNTTGREVGITYPIGALLVGVCLLIYAVWILRSASTPNTDFGQTLYAARQACILSIIEFPLVAWFFVVFLTMVINVVGIAAGHRAPDLFIWLVIPGMLGAGACVVLWTVFGSWLSRRRCPHCDNYFFGRWARGFFMFVSNTCRSCGRTG